MIAHECVDRPNLPCPACVAADTFVPCYIRSVGPAEVGEYLLAQEEMYEASAEADAARERIQVANQELEVVVKRIRALLEKYPTLAFRRSYK